MAKTAWQINTTVPLSEINHFSLRGLLSDNQKNATATFFVCDKKGNVREVKRLLADYENSLEKRGVQSFSLEATPSVER